MSTTGIEEPAAVSSNGRNSAIPSVHASNGCSQPQRPAPKWVTPIRSRRPTQLRLKLKDAGHYRLRDADHRYNLDALTRKMSRLCASVHERGALGHMLLLRDVL